jgi:hypothetical protein
MGGPVNKVAFLFGSALIAEGNYAVMGMVAVAVCTPPIIIASIIILAPCILFNQVVNVSKILEIGAPIKNRCDDRLRYGRSSKQSSIFIWFSTDC